MIVQGAKYFRQTRGEVNTLRMEDASAWLERGEKQTRVCVAYHLQPVDPEAVAESVEHPDTEAK